MFFHITIFQCIMTIKSYTFSQSSSHVVVFLTIYANKQLSIAPCKVDLECV